jgi:hypothetical protein
MIGAFPERPETEMAVCGGVCSEGAFGGVCSWPGRDLEAFPRDHLRDIMEAFTAYGDASAAAPQVRRRILLRHGADSPPVRVFKCLANLPDWKPNCQNSCAQQISSQAMLCRDQPAGWDVDSVELRQTVHSLEALNENLV